ncbi:MAG: hypothetical protein H2B05_04425 [Nitrosopumilaceae archaeon]|jgi:hypothetical protein|uniref:Uncharacterized protein n=3 Tax=Candidatus Nitrosomaritimum aestuariumsis TaxID=3342354 RepID=A0AC60W3M9_9ARCH|nr:hypothetical protein [Nitrosopumilaceae archaeon]MBA4454171.1 hypothetical protein [Nitrosopumilaceae archaeon]MBA4459782.1 hypothetical protein [Nitrosopumilaceae archaeon]MBA4462529.1 hypothetical protein [Nitrosopumilaceae archaeon]MBA4463250.1 hypothetical protein [Nitrosopumilaceae archaeon]
MDHNALCTKVLEIEPHVRFSGILNSRGDLTVQSNRNDSEALLSEDEVKMSVHYTFQRWTSIQNLAHKIGTEKTNITEFDKVTLISLLLDDGNLLLLSSEPGANYMEIISKVKQIIPDE